MAAGCVHAAAQAPGVPICNQARPEADYKTEIINAARGLMAKGAVLKIAPVQKQLNRASCQLTLSEVCAKKLRARDIGAAPRRSHVRIGWVYLCAKCSKWHAGVAGGYWLTADGAAATCFHVVEPGRDLKEGCLVAVDDRGKVFPVAEVLAADRESDACIVRVAGAGFTPLALNAEIYPGDAAYCYSDPLDHREYFSAGIVNRFYQRAGARVSGAATPTRINVSTDWAPGSSGSAILDECGNVIGHVSTVSSPTNEPAPKAQQPQPAKAAPIIFHEGVSARDVLRLIKAAR
jgi:hypothetical protein